MRDEVISLHFRLITGEMRKIFVLFIFFYLLVLFQVSFFGPILGEIGWFFNFILISIILIALFEKPKSFFSLFSAFIGGFFLDIFSEKFFGFWILTLLILAIFLKFILRKYVQPVIRLKS